MANIEGAKSLKEEIEKSGANLIAVSKKFPAEKIKEVHAAGIVDFGENYVAEAIDKIESLKSLSIRWHFIGRVQTGNLNKIIDKFYLLHSLYKIGHIRKINERSKKIQKILLQLQLNSDSRGFGLNESEILKITEQSSEFKKIDFGGLMFMPPPELSEQELQRAFKWAKQVFDSLKNKMSETNSWDTLSMGMSSDYKLAIDAGSTHVRIGSAIFGQRS